MTDIFRAPVRVPRSQVPQFLSQHWPQLQAGGGVEANFKLADFTLEPQAPRFLLELKGGEKIEVSRRQTVKFKEMMSL